MRWNLLDLIESVGERTRRLLRALGKFCRLSTNP